MPLPKSEEPAPAGNGFRPSTQTTSAALHYTAHARIIDALRDHDVLDKGDKARARCPAHNGTSSTSLSIGPRRDGKGVVVCCHAGCATKDILAAIGLSTSDLFDEDKARAVYAPRRDYSYPCGRVVHRKPNKDFPQSGNTKGNSLFHADKIGDAQTVYVPEGEKDVEAIELAGGAAVCPAMGAGKADKFDWSPLRDKHAIIIADRPTGTNPAASTRARSPSCSTASPRRFASLRRPWARTPPTTSRPTRRLMNWSSRSPAARTPSRPPGSPSTSARTCAVR
jgi:hypothetical protein